MDLFDKLGSILPFLIFALITILGNLGDKKKPKVKMKTKPFPKGQKLPDIKPPTTKEQVETIPAPIPQPELPRKHRSHHPAEYEQVHNPYQSYLEKKYQQDDLAQAETLKTAEEDTQLGQEKPSRAASSWGWRICLWHRLFCQRKYWASLVAVSGVFAKGKLALKN